MSLYVYAFTDEPADTNTIGLADQPVRWITEGQLHAAVSDAPPGRLRPQRRHLAAHQRVLADLATRTATLPASFGLVAESEQQLKDLLHEQAETIAEQLERVAGRVEVAVKLAWDVPDLFEHLTRNEPEIRETRDRLAALGDHATHDDKVNAGRTVERTIQALKQQHAQTLRDAIEPAAIETAESEPPGDNEIIAIACLIEKHQQAEFEAAAERVAQRFDENFLLSITGPFAPHNFVTLNLAAESQAA